MKEVTRSEAIEILTELEVERFDEATAAQVVQEGCTGFDNMSNEELNEILEPARFSMWKEIALYLAGQLNAMDTLSARIFTPSQPSIQPACIPRVALSFDPGSEQSPVKWKDALWQGKPSIAVEAVRDEIWLNPHTMTMEEAEIILQRIRSIIKELNQ